VAGGFEAAEVVEAELRVRVGGEDRGGPPVEVPQEAVSEAVVGDRAQLLLDALDRAGGRFGPEVEADRVGGGEPADRTGQVQAIDDLFAAVPFQAEQYGRAGVGSPGGHGEGHRGQQDVVDAGAEHGRYPAQQ